MKRKYLIVLFSGLMLGSLSGCLKSKLLDQNPQTSISDATYWHTANDLKLYTNNFYQKLPSYIGQWGTLGPYSEDDNTDNMVYGGYNTQLNGERTVPASGGGWSYSDWSNIRDVNYFLLNYNKVSEPFSAISTYVGEAYFFRAWFYFSKLQSFGNLPWINKPLTTNDTSFLIAPVLSRNVIVDSILSDLNNAVATLLPKGSAENMRLYKEYAQAFKSRVALYEGTWEKYHKNDAFGVPGQDGTKFLQIAANAADSVINSGKFALDNVGVADGYWSLFNQTDYSGSKEIMFWRAYSFEDLITQHWNQYSSSGANRGVTKSMVDAYLCTDGQPIAVSPLYEGDDSLNLVVANRDPRLKQTIYTPGDMIFSASTYPTGQALLFQTPALADGGETRSITGYQLYKSHSLDYNQAFDVNQDGITGLIFMRYAEVLLNAAEAKAELGTITQEDLDQTINLLRDRVGMPHLVLGSIVTDPNWKFPSLTPVINEVRRERRVELSCEGFRFDDIMRWAAADELIVGWKPLGAKWNQWATVITKITVGKDIYLNPQGYIEPFQRVATMPNGYQFNINRDYLSPIPTRELTLNPNLKQNPGW
jgi:hypothetical protein